MEVATKLWQRVRRTINAFLVRTWRDGALFGATPQEAFYVKCNGETNPPELRDSGRVVTEIGLASTIPFEFVVVRLIHSAEGHLSILQAYQQGFESTSSPILGYVHDDVIVRDEEWFARVIKEFDDPAWDPVWSACEDLGMVLTTHAGAGDPTSWTGRHGFLMLGMEAGGAEAVRSANGACRDRPREGSGSCSSGECVLTLHSG